MLKVVSVLAAYLPVAVAAAMAGGPLTHAQVRDAIITAYLAAGHPCACPATSPDLL